MNTKAIVLKEILRLENSIKKRSGIEVKKFNNGKLSEYITKLAKDNVPFEEDTPYANYDAWLADVAGIDSKFDKQLAKIDDNAAMLQVLNTYINDHAADM